MGIQVLKRVVELNISGARLTEGVSFCHTNMRMVNITFASYTHI